MIGVEVDRSQPVPVVRFMGVVDASTLPTLREWLAALLAPGELVTIDLRPLRMNEGLAEAVLAACSALGTPASTGCN